MKDGRIRVLDELVADQIAAGEVVERPGSVVKELLENALDAGATKIQLDIDGGGVRRVRVFDNGGGINPEDLEVAFARHATSKISAIEDLDNPLTYGFRGEALSSITAVSKIEIRTRRQTDTSGTMISLEAGKVIARREAGCPVGTDIEVKDLFFNTPARLKFLKKESTETAHCTEAMIRLAACCPEVAFAMKSGGRRVKELPRVERIEERIASMFASEELVRSEGAESGVKVLAILGPPERARAGAGSLYTYVANRYMRDKTLLRAVTQAFGGTLESGRYPVGLIAIELPPGSFDVNVHPQKIEVRFADPTAVYHAVVKVVGEMVARAVWTFPDRLDSKAAETTTPFKPAKVETYRPAGRLVPLPGEWKRHWTTTANETFSKDTETSMSARETDLAAQLLKSTQPSFEMQPLPAMQTFQGRFVDFKYIGQAQNLFLLFETDSDLVIIDQHAAHERVTYENLRKQTQSGRVLSQRLLVPHTVDLGVVDAERIEECSESLARLGMEVSRSGPDRIAIHSLPAELEGVSPDRLLADMVIALEESREGSKGATDDDIIAKMACHGSIRAGRSMAQREVEALLTHMEKIDFAGHCPHGRPVLTRIPFKEIMRRFGRG